MPAYQKTGEFTDDLGSLIGVDESQYNNSAFSPWGGLVFYNDAIEPPGKSLSAKRQEKTRTPNADNLGNQIGDDASQYYNTPESTTQKKSKSRSKFQKKQDLGTEMQRNQYKDQYKDAVGSLVGDDVSRFDNSDRHKKPSDRRSKRQLVTESEMQLNQYKDQYKDDLGSLIGDDANQYDKLDSATLKRNKERSKGQGELAMASQMEQNQYTDQYKDDLGSLIGDDESQYGNKVRYNSSNDHRSKSQSAKRRDKSRDQHTDDLENLIGYRLEDIGSQVQRNQYTSESKDFGSASQSYDAQYYRYKTKSNRSKAAEDRRSKSQPAKRLPKRQDYDSRLAFGPDENLSWDGGVSPPTATGANAMPGYGGHIAGVYSENIIGLASPRAGQRGAYTLNNIERTKEKEKIRGKNRDKIQAQDASDQIYGAEDIGKLMDTHTDLSDVKNSLLSSAETSRSSPRSPRKGKSKSQPAQRENRQRSSAWSYAGGVKLFAIRPDPDLQWDGPVSPTSPRACTSTPGYSGHKPGVYSENVIALVTQRSTQRAAQVLNDLERVAESPQQENNTDKDKCGKKKRK